MLSEVFQQIWDAQDGGLDPDQLRDKAFAALDRADYADALYEAMLNDAYAFILAQRGKRPTPIVRAAAYAKPQQADVANSARSPKHRAVRDQWPMLRCSYSVAHGQRKNLESMSAEDCQSAAKVSRALSDGNLRRAEWLEKISAELISANVRVVARLPAAVLTELQDAAP